MQRGNDELNGVIVVNKPQGPTSHDVVNAVRKISGQRRVGHLGTLDPIATGVLPLCVGRATRLAQFLQEGMKRYEATLLLGVTTDTQDVSGTVTAQRNVLPEIADKLDAAARSFIGDISQMPPAYSAVKHSGTPLYKFARRGEPVDAAPRTVSITELDVRAVRLPWVEITVECSRGTYIRTLCHDIGETLGCGATLAQLRRTVSGRFSEEDAVELHLLRTRSDVESRLTSPGDLLDELGLVVVIGNEREMVLHGREVCRRAVGTARSEPTQEAGGGLIRVYDEGGAFLALAEARCEGDDTYIVPRKVLATH